MNCREKQKRIAFFLNTVIVLAYTAAFFLVWTFSYANHMDHPYGWKGKVLLTIVYMIACAYLVKSFGGTAVGVNRIRDILYAHAVAIGVCDFGAYVFLIFLCSKVVSPLPILLLMVIQAFFALLWSVHANKQYFRFAQKRRTAIFYSSPQELKKITELPFFYSKSTLVRTACTKEKLFKPELELEDIDCTFLIGVDPLTRSNIIDICQRKHIRAIVVPEVDDVVLEGAQMACLNGDIYFAVDDPLKPWLYLLVKRITDISLSILALVVLSPMLAVIALIIRGYDGGPVLYRQTRLTKNGKSFTLYKFRSMGVDAEKDGIARLSTESDSRITPIGKLLRAYRLDELPQLFNIIRGDMTIVGPRPERPEIAALYERTIPSFELRLQVRAGLTGYAQVYGRYNTTPYDKLKMDLFYINHMSAFNDVKLILATVKVLFTKEATQGVEDGMVTAADMEMIYTTENESDSLVSIK